jgi:hypothetical protein
MPLHFGKVFAFIVVLTIGAFIVWMVLGSFFEGEEVEGAAALDIFTSPLGGEVDRTAVG